MSKLISLAMLWFMVALQGHAQWTDNGAVITTSDKVGINKSDPGNYQLYINGDSFANGTIYFPSVTDEGTTTQTLMKFPARSDAGSFISRQLSADKYELLLKMQDNIT